MISCETCIWYKQDTTAKMGVHKPSGWCLYNPPVVSTAEGRPRTYAEDRCNSHETPEEWNRWREDILEMRSAKGEK